MRISIPTKPFVKTSQGNLKEELEEALVATHQTRGQPSVICTFPLSFPPGFPQSPGYICLVAKQRAGQKRAPILIWDLKFGQEQNKRITTFTNIYHFLASPGGTQCSSDCLLILFVKTTILPLQLIQMLSH